MEPETWLLADPKVVERVDATLTPHPTPEQLRHPTNHLKGHWEAKRGAGSYRKLQIGTYLFSLASAKRVYDDNCPHFQLLVDWLLNPPPEAKNNPVGERVRLIHARLDVLDQEITIRLAAAQTDDDLDQIMPLEAERDELWRQLGLSETYGRE